MYPVAVFAPGNYRFVPGVLPYSRAVAAMPGFRIERVQFSRPAPLAEGFARIEQVLKDAGRQECPLLPWSGSRFSRWNLADQKTIISSTFFSAALNTSRLTKPAPLLIHFIECRPIAA